MHKRNYISASQVQAWIYCPLSFRLKYELKVPQPVSPALNVGKTFHARIANAIAQGQTPRLPRRWLSNYKSIVSGLNLSNDLLIEQKIEAYIDNQKIVGFVDLIDLERKLIVDWKFGKKINRYDVQGYLYKEVVKQVYGVDCDVAFAYIPVFAIKYMQEKDYDNGQFLVEAFKNRSAECVSTFSAGSKKCQACGYYLFCMNPENIRCVEEQRN